MEAKEKDLDGPRKTPTGTNAADWREEQRRVAERAAQDESLNLSFNNLAVEFRTMFRDGKIEQLTNGVTLSSEAWLGYQNGMGSLVGTESVVLKTGKHFALVNLRKKSYSLWKRPTPGMKVQALTHGLSKREQLVLAYAQMRGTRPILCVLKHGKERALQMPHDLIGQEDWQISSIVLAGKHAVTLSRSQAGSVISYWNYEKERLTQRGDFKYQLKKIAVSSVNSNQMVGAGKGLLRFFQATQKKVLEATTRLLSTKVERENDFVDVKFCNQAVVAVSSQNNLVIVENNTVRYYNKIDHLLKDDLSRYIETYDETLDQDSKSTSDGLFDQKDSRCKAAGVAPAFQFSGQGVQSNTLAVWPRGIVVATRNGGLLTYLEYDKEPIRIGTFPCPDAQNISTITGLSLSADEKHLLVMAQMPIKQCLNAEQQPSVNARQWASVSDIQWGGPIFPKSDDESPQTPEEALKRIRNRTELYLLEIKQLKTFANSFTTPMVRLLGSRARNPVGRVTGLAAPAVRGVVLTGHEDATLRMWAHQGSLPRQTQSLSCHDVPLSVAIQPSGLVGAAGFRDGMKAYFVLEQSISVAASWHGKPCQAVSFSRSGKLLAAGNGSCITIVDSLSLDIVYVLSQHPGLVEGLRFSQNDTHLMSYCGAGLCYVWSSDFDQYDCHIPASVPKGGLHHQTRRAGLPGFGRQFELIAKPHRVLSFDYDDEYDLMVAATSDGRLRIVEKLGREPYMEVGFDPGVEPTTLQIIKQQEILVIGQSDGSVRVVLWPILNVTQVKGVRVAVSLLESLQFKTHEGSVTSLDVTPDCKSLLTGGADGSVFVHSLKDVAAGALDNSLGSVFLEGPIAEAGHKKHRNIGAAYGSVSEYARLDQVGYVLKAEVMERREQVRVLRKRLVTERAQLTKKLEQSESNWSQKMATRQREVSAALAAEKEAADRAAAGHEAEKTLLLQKIEENAVRVRKEKEERQIQVQAKLSEAMDQVQTLQEQLEVERFQHRTQLGQILTEQRQAFDLLQREFGEQVAALGAAHARALAQVQRTDTKYEAALEQTENEYEREVAKARLAFLDKQKLLAEKCQELKAGEELEMRKVKKLNLRLEALEERYNSTTQAQLSMALQCEGRDRKLIEMQEQLQEREDVIRAKEATIRELRELNSQLENFRFVLDQKLLAMQSEQEPMQAQLRHLEAHVQRMFQEMVKATQERQRLEKDNAEKQRRSKALHSQLQVKAQSVRSLKYKLDGILSDLTFMLAHHRDSFDLAQRLATLFRKHAPDSAPPMASGEQQKAEKVALPVQDELKRQRDWLDKKLQTVVERHKKLEQQKNEHIQRIQRENCKLIEECNVLRNDNQTIAKKVVELEKRLRTIAGARDATDQTTSLASADLNGLNSPGAAFLRRASQNPRGSRKPFLSRVEQESQAPQLKHLLTNMQKNKDAIEGQGRDMARLEQRMSAFLAEEGRGPEPPHPHSMHHPLATQNTHTQPDEQSLSGEGGRSFSPIHPQRPEPIQSPHAHPQIMKSSPPHAQFRGTSPTRPNASVGSQPSISNILQHKYSIQKSSSTHQARKFFREQSPPTMTLTRQEEPESNIRAKKFSLEYRSPSQTSPPRSPRLLSAEQARNAPSLLSPQALRDSQHPPSIQLPSLKGAKKFKSRRNSTAITPQVGGFSGGKKLAGGKSVKSLRRGTSPTPPSHH